MKTDSKLAFDVFENYLTQLERDSVLLSLDNYQTEQPFLNLRYRLQINNCKKSLLQIKK
jgi:hypothetical protein